MNLIKNLQTIPNMAHSASLGRFEGPFSPTMNLINPLSPIDVYRRHLDPMHL